MKRRSTVSTTVSTKVSTKVSRVGTGISLVLLCMAAGCSITPESGVVFFPRKDRLTKRADKLRRQHAHPIAIARETAKQPMPEYRLEPGDVVQIEPVRPDSVLEFPANQPVQPDGTVDLGRYGRVPVAGMTVDEVETAVDSILEERSPNSEGVEVILIEWVSKVFYIDGEVRSPGAYPMEGRETVLDAIFEAGGLTKKASHQNIILSRVTAPCSCRVVLPVCYDDIFQLGDSTTNYQIRPGDRIFVPAVKTGERLKNACKNLPCALPQIGCSLPVAPCCDVDLTCGHAQPVVEAGSVLEPVQLVD